MSNLYSLFKSRFQTVSAKPCIVSPEGEVQLSFEQLDKKSAQMAGLLGELGVTKGDRVVVQALKSIEVLLVYLACLRRGVIFIPLNIAYTHNEVDYFLASATPSLLVCDPANYAGLEQSCYNHQITNVLTLDATGVGSLMQRFEGSAVEEDIVTVDKHDTAVILYTSGTTGVSKGAMLSHENLSSNALALHKIWGWQPDDVLLHALPIFHAHGLFVGVHLALLNASTMIYLAKFELNPVIENISQATVFMGVPTFYTRLLESSSFSSETCNNMRLFISGSAPLLEDTFYAFEKRSGHKILERYGMTEAVMITSNPLDGDRLPGTVGFPLPDVKTRVVDDEGKPLTYGEIGNLEIQGPNVFKGYWKMPEKTQQEFTADNYFRTGDLATQDKEGRVAIVGRSKDLIISGGYNIYPKEIEGYIDAIDGVKESAVIGLAHKDFGEAVTAIVILHTGENLSEQTIVEQLQANVARFKLPKKVFFLDELPRNAMGKVQKQHLRTEFSDTYQLL